jgi:catechol 2,3-dioxygenase-like lactoylglutathione lyase family enzyme
MQEQFQHQLRSPTTRGVHHLALCADDMKATIDFYVEMLGVPLVHAMKVPPGLGLKPLATTDLCQDTKSGRPNSVFIKAG